MNPPNPIDLNTCKSGQKLRTKHGTILTYVGKMPVGSHYPHEIKYPNGSSGTRCDDGFVFYKNRLDSDEDIVEIIPMDSIKYKIYTQEQIREQIAEFLKDCDEDKFMEVAKICFGPETPMFEQELCDKGFRKISMFY